MSYNIHALYLTDAEKYTLREELKQRRPPMVVVMDDLAFAVSVKPFVGEVVYRNYPLSRDNIHHTMSPEAWLLSHRSFYTQYGLTLYCNNEPGYDQVSIDWHLEVAKLCVKNKIKVVLMNLSVGNPADGWHVGWNDLLRYIGANPEFLRLGLHEYFPSAASYEYGDMPKISDFAAYKLPVTLRTWLCGRFLRLFDYCRQNGIPIPLIAFTEFGTDEVTAVSHWQRSLPGYRYPMLFRNNIPYYSLHSENPALYYAEMMNILWGKVYYPHSEHILGCAVFNYGSMGGSQWQTSDVKGTDVPKYLKTFRVKGGSVADNGVIVTPGSVLQPVKWGTPFNINVRSLPSTSSSVVGVVMREGVYPTYTDSKGVGSGYEWRKVEYEIGKEGWVALIPGTTLTVVSDTLESNLRSLLERVEGIRDDLIELIEGLDN